MKLTKRNFRRALSIICALALILSAMPMMLATSISAAEPETSSALVTEFTTNLVDNMPEAYGCQAPDTAAAFTDNHVGSQNLQRYVQKDAEGKVVGLAVTSPNKSTIALGNMPSVRMFGIIVPTNVEGDALNYNTRRALVADVDTTIEIKVTYDILNVRPTDTVYFGITTGRGSYGSGSGWCHAVKKYTDGSTEYTNQVLEGVVSGNLHAADVLGSVLDADRVGFGFTAGDADGANANAVVVIKEVKVKATYTPYAEFKFSTNLVDDMPDGEATAPGTGAVWTNDLCGSKSLWRYDHKDGLAVYNANANVNNVIAGYFTGVRSFGLFVPTTVSSPLVTSISTGAMTYTEGFEVKIKLTYDILNLGGKTAAVSISAVGGYNAGSAYGYGFNKHAAAEEYKNQVLEATVSGAPYNGTYNKLGFSFAAEATSAELIIKNVEVTVIKPAKIQLNDNGVITPFLGKAGSDLPDGTNALVGENFMGWYDNPHFTGEPLTKAPEKGMLYARYPSVVIDAFNMSASNFILGAYGKEPERTAGKSYYSGGTLSISNGVLTYANQSASGFTLPAYDDMDCDMYEFVPGNQYRVTIYAKNVDFVSSTIDATKASWNLVGGTYTAGLGRDTSIGITFPELNTVEALDASDIVSEKKFTFSPSKAITNLSFRTSDDKSVFKIEIDKIVITQLTGGTEDYFYTPLEGDYNLYCNGTKTVVSGGNLGKDIPAEYYENGVVSWHTNPNLTDGSLVTKFPNSQNLFAKVVEDGYYKTVIDYNYVTKEFAGKNAYIQCTSFNVADGKATWKSLANLGYMIPAYDYLDANGDYSFYQFEDGKEYTFEIYYSAAETFGGNFTAATTANGSGERYTGTTNHETAFSLAAGENKVYTKTFTYGITSTKFHGMCLRATADKTVVLDKIVIKTKAPLPAGIHLYNGEDLIETLDPEDGIVKLPVPDAPAGKIFVGWYKYDVATFNGTKTIGADVIPVAYVDYKGTDEGINLYAQFADEEAVIDFSAHDYPTEASSESGNHVSRGIKGIYEGNTCIGLNGAKAGESGNAFKIDIYESGDKPFILYDGVKYKFTVSGKVNELSSVNGYAQISIARTEIGGGMNPTNLGRSAGNWGDPEFILNETGEFTIEPTLLVEGMYDTRYTSGAAKAGVKNMFAFEFNSGDVDVTYIKVEALEYVGDATPVQAKFDGGVVNVDYANKTATIVPDEGYEATSFKVTTILNPTADSTKAGPAKDYVYDIPDDFIVDFSDSAANFDLNTIKVVATFKLFGTNFSIPEKSTSIRGADGEGETYVSAGIRFRGNISAASKAAASEIGFYVIPSAYLEEQMGKDDIVGYINAGGDQCAQGICYQAGGKDVIWEEYEDGSCDYQVILVGLTAEGSAADLLNTEFSIVMYTIVDDETYFGSVLHDSYNAALERLDQ